MLRIPHFLDNGLIDVLSIQCGVLNISERIGPRRPVTGRALHKSRPKFPRGLLRENGASQEVTRTADGMNDDIFW
jgi:hypothetical protein